MLERFRLSSLNLNYRFHNQTLARNKNRNPQCVTVLFLDDTTHTFRIEKNAKGLELLDKVFRFLDLSERDYFGLIFPQNPGAVVRWVDSQKLFGKQCIGINLENLSVPAVEFRVKFFVNDPSRLREEYTRYQFYLQIKRNVYQGKLSCSINTQCLLASYTVQAELGDFNPEEHKPGYLSNLQLLSDQTLESERKISELHKLHRGQLPADAEYNYLEQSKRLELYGMSLHNAKDSNGIDLLLGVSAIGLSVFQNNLRINIFSWSKMVKVSFKRKDFFIQLRRENSECYETLLGFSMISNKHAKALWKSCVEHHSFFRLKRPPSSRRFLNIGLRSKFYYSGKTELQTLEESNQRGISKKKFLRSPSKRLITYSSDINETNSLDNSSCYGKPQTPQLSILAKPKNNRTHDNKVTSKDIGSVPRKAWDDQSENYDTQFNSDFMEYCPHSFEPSNRSMYYNNSEKIIQRDTKKKLINGFSKNSKYSDNELISIHLQADEQGRFGFNVKGGVDLGVAVQVSKVVPYTPADRSSPRIAEGDEVVMINEQEISGMKHEEVIGMIRDFRDLHNGKLVLKVRPKANTTMLEEEPLYQYVPENTHSVAPIENQLEGQALFTQSLLLLCDGLASGALLTQYELMYRRNPDLPITEAKKPENLAKNRYRDISPYDCSRVTLVNSKTGDYINASYINIEVPEGTVNRYIATQGPLYNTTTDFWRMVQQESSHLIVMLTTVMEAGRQKCHQYWPVMGEELELDEEFSVKCLSEKPDETGSFVFREFLLSDKRFNEQRHIQHMQYLAWPDHCVPTDPNLFLEFTKHVQSARNKSLLQEIQESLKQVRLLDADADGSDGIIVERKCAASNGETPEEEIVVPTYLRQCISAANPPIIVHCSAGIGRTGVLILMDTALALIKAKEPVYPLDIVKSMRDQRTCMVQNVSQYRFVCECICAANMKISTDNSVKSSPI